MDPRPSPIEDSVDVVGQDEAPSLTPADVRWLAVEFAAAALEGPGPDEALTVLYDRIPGESLDGRLIEVAGTGHPDAARVASAVRDFVGSGAIPSIDQVYQLKVGLARWRPPIWRRVLVPATITLGDLRVVIQILFGWGGDHLHMFEVGCGRCSPRRPRSAISTTSARVGGMRSRWRRLGSGNPAPCTRCAPVLPATPQWSTGLKMTRKRRNHSISPRSTDASPVSTTQIRRASDRQPGR